MADERRRHYRAEVIGCAILHAPPATAIRCEIANLSLGGVLLRPDASTPTIGTRVDVEIELAGSGWITQRGTVHRNARDVVAIVFDHVSAHIEDLIEDEIVAAMEAQQVPRVVVIDSSSERRQQVAAALVEAGCAPLEAATPLEALRLMDRAGTGVSGVAIGETNTQTDRDELVDFLVDTNPGIQVSLIGAPNPRGGDLREPARAFGVRLRQPTGPISTIGRARRS
jgi:hypothetical protein